MNDTIFRKRQVITEDADKSLARPTSRFILFDGENISFDASLVIYIKSTNIPPIMIINRIYETQNLLSLKLVSFLVGLRTYQHSCKYKTYIDFLYKILSETLLIPRITEKYVIKNVYYYLCTVTVIFKMLLNLEFLRC